MTQWPVRAVALALMGCAAEDPVPPPPSREPPPGSERFGVFEGKVPCSNCERVKVRLTLHRSELDESPTAYVLERIGVGNGDERLVTRGNWATSPGPQVAPCSTVVDLGDGPADFARYMLLGRNLLLLLGADGEPRVGNAVHSFTLSRTE